MPRRPSKIFFSCWRPPCPLTEVSQRTSGASNQEQHGGLPKKERRLAQCGHGVLAVRKEREMIVTTTPGVEGKTIRAYKGIVFGEVVAGVDFVKDFAAGLSNFFGGRSGSYEGELVKAREEALSELERRAGALG